MQINRFAIEIAKDEKGREYFLHLRCNRKSYNPNDIRYKYCAVCHTFPEDEGERERIREELKRSLKKRFGL